MRPAAVFVFASALAALLAVSCDSTTEPAGTGTGGSTGTGACVATISGAVNASAVQCFASAGTDSDGDDMGAVAFTFTAPTGYQVTAGIQTIGTPTTRTYANTDSDAKGACEVVQNGTAQTWAAAAGSSGGTGDQGTYSLDVNALGQEVSNPDGGPGNAFLTVHGSLNCTMPAYTVTGASGSITLTATF